MSEISKLKVNNALYEIKDPNARNQLDKLHGIDGIEYNPISGSIGLISASIGTLGGVKTGFPETDTKYPINIDNYDRAYADLSNFTVGGRNLAIYKTAYITSLTTYLGNYTLRLNTADTKDHLLLLICVNEPNKDTVILQITISNISTVGYVHYTAKLSLDTSQIKVKGNGALIDSPYIRFILPKTLKANTWVTVSLEITNVTLGSFTFKNIKIEEGKVATTWTPAPEDIVIGGKNLTPTNWADPAYLYAYAGATMISSRVNSVPEFVGSNSLEPAIRVTTSGGTSKRKLLLRGYGLTNPNKNLELVWSIYAKNNSSKVIRIAGNRYDYNYQLLNPGKAKRIVISEIAPANILCCLLIIVETVSDNLDITLWRPQCQIGNVATEYNSPDELPATTTLDGLMSASDKIKLDSLSNYTLPAATSTTLGGVKLGSDTSQPIATNPVSTTANRTYAVLKNSSNLLVVNVPWSNSNTDTKVTQSPTNINTEYNILTTAANRTSSVTDVANFSTKLTYNPSTSTLKNNECSQVYDSTNKCLKFVFS